MAAKPHWGCAWKFRLVRGLYERGYERAVVLELFRIIDWLVQLPEGLEKQFLAEVHELEEEGAMPFVAPAERIWKDQGIQKGKQEGRLATLLDILEVRFGEVDAGIRDRLAEQSEEQLRDLTRRALTASSLEELLHRD